MMQTTYKFKLYPNKAQYQALVRDQRNVCYIRNRMLGDREQSQHNRFVMGDYCSLYNKKTYLVTALRCDLIAHQEVKLESNLEVEAIGNGLCCSINGYVSLGDPWRTGDENKKRRSKKTTSDTTQKKKAKPVAIASQDELSLMQQHPRTKSSPLRRSICEMQQAALPVLKVWNPDLKATSATAYQKACQQLNEAFSKFFKQEAKYPRYKRASDAGIHYPSKECKVDVVRQKVYLPGIGWVRFRNSRSFREGMTFSKFAVTRENDQWYVSFLVKDSCKPEVTPMEPDAVQTIVGGDKGIKKLLAVSGKTQFQNPQFLKAEERRLAIRQRRVSRKKKGSKNRTKAAKQLASLHQKIRRRREDYQWKVAHQFTELADAVAIEELNVKGMMKRCRPKRDESGQFISNGQSAKSQLNKAIADASWHALDQKIKHQAQKQGKLCISVEPSFTSQECPECHHVDASNRDGTLDTPER